MHQMTAATAEKNIVVKQPQIDTPSSITSNPQQGMSDNGVLPNSGTAASKGPIPPLAPCSPLTISSALEQQQQSSAAAENSGVAVAADGVPVSVVGGPFMEAPPPGVPVASAVPVSDERRWKRTPPTESDPRKLFVGGLPTNVNDEQFLCFFEQFGEVIDSVVMVDRNTKRSRGFGFVTFANQEVTNSLLNNIPGKTGILNIFGKSCEIKASEPKVDDGRHDSPSTRRYNYNGNNNSGGKKTMMQQFNNQHHNVAMQNQYNNRDNNGYTGDERDFDDVNYNRFEPNQQGYYNQGYHNHHQMMMMYHQPYGYSQYQHYPPNYSNYDGPGPNYEGGEGGGAPYHHNYYSNGFYPNQQQFVGQYGNPMNYGGNGEGVPPYPQAQQQHANYGGYYPQGGQMYQGQFSDGGSVDSKSYEAQVYPATTSGVDGDYDQAAAGET